MTDSIRWGERGGNVIWESSGAGAGSIMTRMPLSGGRAMRVDLQQTLTLSEALPAFGMRCLPLAETIPHPRLPSGTRVGLESRSDGSWCGRVAPRTAPEHFRLYDKGIESRQAPSGRMWRLELELKYADAEAVCREHRARLTDPQWCADYLTSRWFSHGCFWPVRAERSVVPRPEPAPTPEQTVGELAVWLTRSVRPTIPRLLKGFTVAEVLRMLDLELVAQPRRRLDSLGGGSEATDA